MRLPVLALTAAFALSALAACGGDDDGEEPVADASPADPDAEIDEPDAADPGDVPRIEATPCRYEIAASLGLAEGVDYRCGDLIVFEDRAMPTGRTLRLHYLQMDGAQSDVATIYLDGGPGGDGSGILSYLAFSDPALAAGLLAGGDFLVISQRGTGLSEPALTCMEGAAECGQRLSTGATLSAFSTASNADDIDDLRAALGYEELNLYGISYGSRLALEVLRRHGDRVRAAVAGGTVPAQIVWPAEIPASFHGALEALSASCAADAACEAAYGDLTTAMLSGITALNAEPAIFDYQGFDISINGGTYSSLLFQLFYSRSSYPMLPLLITDLADGRTDRVSAYLTTLFDSFDQGGGGVASGMYYSIVCGELFNPASDSAFDAANVDVPPILRDTMAGNWYGLLQTCAQWPVGAPTPDLAELVTSDVPTLVPNGRLDPITPPRFGDAAATGLSASTVVTFANSGHGSTLQTACGNQVLLDFFADPTGALDTSCAAEVPIEFTLPASFAPPSPADLERLRFELSHAPVPPHMRTPAPAVKR